MSSVIMYHVCKSS